MFIPVNLSEEELEKLLEQTTTSDTQDKVKEQSELVEQPPKQTPNELQQVSPRQPSKPQQSTAPIYLWGLFLMDLPEIYVDGINFYFHAEISKDSVEQLKKLLLDKKQQIIQNYMQLGITDLNQMQVNLIINSPGGSVSDGFDLIDFLTHTYGLTVNTIGSGVVASMAVPLLLCGQERKIMPHTHILIHQFRTGFMGKRQDILDLLKHLEAVHQQLVEYIASKSKLSQKQVDEIMQSESWFTAEDALKMGLVDKIVGT